MYVCEPIHTEYLDVSEEKASYQIESISGMVSWGKIEITLFLGAQPVVTLVARHRRVFHLRDVKHDLTFSFNYAKLF
ncbi:hypothetical protein AB205_0178610, partial [Aquarana catesbeiana]